MTQEMLLLRLTPTGRYVARPYNFYLSPLPATKEQVFQRVWSYNSGAISFLVRNGFSIDRPILQGVHYLSRQEEDQVRKKLLEEELSRSKIPDMVLKEEDSCLVEHIKQSIKEWQSLPKGKQEPYLNIPADSVDDTIPSVLNRYQVRLTHQIVRKEHPNLKTQGMGHFVQITNPTSKQQANEKESRGQKRELEVANAIGFRWILEAIMGGDLSKLPHYYVASAFADEDAPKDVQAFLSQLETKLKSNTRALVGHNCLTDVVNLYRCFIGDLPESVQEFSARLHELFPIILDTKFVAGLGNKPWADTSLKAVESDLCSVGLPHIHLPTDFDRYLYASNYHEAGFDSFVTAKIGLKMTGKLKREGKDVKSLVEKSAPAVEEKTNSVTTDSQQETATESHREGENQKRGLAQSIVEVITAPVIVVKSLLTGTESGTQEGAGLSASGQAASSLQTADKLVQGTFVASREKQQPVQTSKSELKQLKSISRTSNIFNMLEENPEEASEGDDAEQAMVEEQNRIAEMMRKGQLMPRWEEDAEFWKLISNKLQANACQEGVLDLIEP